MANIEMKYLKEPLGIIEREIDLTNKKEIIMYSKVIDYQGAECCFNCKFSKAAYDSRSYECINPKVLKAFDSSEKELDVVRVGTLYVCKFFDF
jgi:hypothetical protein